MKNADAIGFQIRMIDKLIRRKLDTMCMCRNLELSGMQGAMMNYIRKRTDQGIEVYQRDLEQEFQIRRSTATVMLQNLEASGFLVRAASSMDGRMKRILLTSKAMEQSARLEQTVEQFNDRLERGVTPEERQAFFQILAKLRKNLEEDETRGNDKDAGETD